MKYRSAILLWLAAGLLPAAADSRDLVLDRLSRCYTLAEARQYLDCLYAAAQPMRNELNLPPAPQAANYAALFSRPAAASAYVPPAGAAAPARPQAAESEGFFSGLVSGVIGAKTPKVAPEQFGLRNARPGPGTNIDHITARMTQYSINGNGFTLTLDNGQVWKQQPGDEHSPRWRKPAASYVATIKYGAMDSYNLTVAGEGQIYKVQRVR